MEPQAPDRGERLGLARFVRTHRALILREWERRVAALPPARGLSHEELVDHLPHLLDRIAAMVEDLEGDRQVGSSSRDADRHALDRLDEGYDLDQVVREFAALRQCVLELWAKEPHRAVGSPVLNAAIDEAVSVAVTRYTSARQRTLVALERIGSASFEAMDLDALLRALASVLLETAAVDSVVIYLAEGDRLEARAAAGLETSSCIGETVEFGSATCAGQIAQTGDPLELRDASNSELASPALRASSARAFYGVPMRHEGRVVGVAHMSSRTAYEFSSEDKLLFRSMVERATAAIVHRQLHEALSRERLRLKAVLEALPVGVWVSDRAGRIVLTNAATREIWGTPLPSVSSMAWHADGRPVDPHEWGITRAIERGETTRAEELEIQRFDGQRRTVLMSGAPIRDEAGRIAGGVSVHLDVTERRAARRALQESEERFRALADNIVQLAWITDAKGNIDWFNRRWHELTDAPPVDGRRPGWAELLPKEHRARVIAKFHEHLRTGEPWEDTFPLVGRDGEARWFLSRAQPIRDERGRVVRWFGTNTDITERMRLEDDRARAVLREREARASAERAAAMIDALFVGAPIGLAFFDLDFRYLRINETLAAINGRAPEEHLGRRVRDVLPEEGAAIEALLAKARDTGAPVTGVEYQQAPPSTPEDVRDWQLNVYPVRLSDGSLVGFGAAVVEFTSLKRALAARDEFLAVASHDLRSPLAAMRLLVEMMQRKVALGPERLDWPWLERKIDKLRHQIDRVTALLQDLLDVSRIRAGRIGLELEELDLARLVEDVVQRHTELFAQHRCELRVDLDGPLVGRWDQLRLEQVVTNLLSNAAKYGAGGPVEVRLASTDDEARLDVRDHGVGIAPADQPRIFERFVRVGDRGAVTGTGLGLWIARQIVEALGGTIGVESAPGQGSTFTVSLPRRMR